MGLTVWETPSEKSKGKRESSMELNRSFWVWHEVSPKEGKSLTLQTNTVILKCAVQVKM